MKDHRGGRLRFYIFNYYEIAFVTFGKKISLSFYRISSIFNIVFRYILVNDGIFLIVDIYHMMKKSFQLLSHNLKPDFLKLFTAKPLIIV